MSRAEQLAEALLKIAQVNHYMVGLIEVVTPDEIDAAEQILIDQQNALTTDDSITFNEEEEAYKQLDLALDLVNNWRYEWRKK